MVATTILDMNERQSKALAITPKFISAISLLASSYIIYDISRLPRTKRKLYHRLMLGMSCCDLCASCAAFLTTWPTPPEVLPVYGAVGTQQTCTAQGFFAQLGTLAGVLYNGGLALYFFLVISLGWTDTKLRKSRVEYYLHGVPILLGLGTTVALTSLGMYNPNGATCWVESVPLGCVETWENRGETTCTRGDDAHLYQWAFFYAPLWLVILAVTVFMGVIVSKFCKQDQKNARYSRHSSMETANTLASLPSWRAMSKRTKQTMVQALCYIGSFLIVYLWPTLTRIYSLIRPGESVYFLLLGTALAVASQGFWNMLIYLRPRYVQLKAERKRKIKQQKREAQYRGGATTITSTSGGATTITTHTTRGGATTLTTNTTSAGGGEANDGVQRRVSIANDALATTENSENRPQDKHMSALTTDNINPQQDKDVSPPVLEQLEDAPEKPVMEHQPFVKHGKRTDEVEEEEDHDLQDGTQTARNQQDPTAISSTRSSGNVRSSRLSQILEDVSKSISLGDSGLGDPVGMMALEAEESLGDDHLEEAPKE